ncbi:Bug family tripartite tricarboxylate transporter substrate binding protein [Candidimonas nitroreducens]|uniref:ABC transporter substrate-binding protein n=1 Tax=Candidimonas nitroreducens TaxID=683354 RepID=A0A225MG81_9BURK|nr:tripartite tricarboxylate transporter substrate-binding protein [Candidimonas nitroreducens]OWT60198.1 ABC transporter substrate-binding protein [Candidimonas nitroreducens]
MLSIWRLGAALLCSLFMARAYASYPEKPITLIVPFAAGSATDSVARIVADGLSKKLGQPVIVQTKAGAVGQIGTEYGARAAPDGYTILMSTSGALAINPALYKSTVRYDPIKDFDPIIMVGEVPFALVVNNKLPVSSIQDLRVYANKHPNRLSFAYASPTSQISSAIFMQMADIHVISVAYKSSPQAVLDLIAGETQLYFIDYGTGLSHIKDGSIKALAVAGKKTSLLPSLPAISDTLPGFSITSWNGILAPHGTPADIITKLNYSIKQVLADPGIKSKLVAIGFEIDGTTSPEQFKNIIKTDVKKWAQWIKQAGIKPH